MAKGGGQFSMKRRKRSEETKTLQNATQKLAEPKGLAFTKAEVPMKRRGTGLMFASTKAREELAVSVRYQVSA